MLQVTVPEPIRLSRRSAPIRFILLHFALVAVVNLVFFASGTFVPLASATGGLLTGSLVANLLFLAVLVAFLLVRKGGVSLSDIGILRGRLPAAIAITLGFWLAAQVIHALAGLFTYGSVEYASVWNSAGGHILLGALLAQLIGNALFEEIAYRGFLFPQVFLRLERLEDHRWLRLGLALLLSQGLFALSHIPNRLYLGLPPDAIALDLIYLLALGILFTFIYVKTGNLFIVIGIHALGNAPTTLFQTAPFLEVEGGSMLIYLLVIAAFYAVPLWWKNRHHLYLRRPAAEDTEWTLSEEAL